MTLRRVAESPRFQNLIIAVIVLAGVVVGLETYDLPRGMSRALHALDVLILGIFVLELAVRLGAEGRRPWRFFLDGWNVFDFVIVVVCFLPLDAEYFAVLRLARLLRVLRLIRSLPKLQVLVGALLKSLPSMGYIGMLLFLLFYLFGVLGTSLFEENDPLHFGSLQVAFLTLYQAATFEGWVAVMDLNFYGCDAMASCAPGAVSTAHGWVAAIYFVLFTMLATMVILNLFIGVIVGGMEEAQDELTASLRPAAHARVLRFEALATQLAAMQAEIEALSDEEQAARPITSR